MSNKPAWAALVREQSVATDRSPESALFDFALKHVLAMEGGWSKDPADPGGATNFGITIAEFAKHRGITLDAFSQAHLEAELRAIPSTTVREIYRQSYWLAARCDLLPGAPAVMHFDAAVNHGVHAATKMLQQAAAVAVDGIIGPVTLAAVRSADPLALIRRYAELRRAAYRRLRIFARFGRGWLLRVDQTLAAAKTQATVVLIWPYQNPKPQETSMTNEPKWWGQSLTIWGTILTGLTTVLPIIGPFIGINVSGALISQLGDQVTHLLQGLGGLIGTLIAVYGRFRATSPLQQSLMTIRL